jgi:two-component system, sensor histidine kinase and response regulator
MSLLRQQLGIVDDKDLTAFLQVVNGAAQGADSNVGAALERLAKLVESSAVGDALQQARDQAAEELRLTEALLDALPHPVSVKDREHRYLRVNAAFEKEFHVERHELLGKTVLDVLQGGAQQVHDIEEDLAAKPGTHSFTQSRRSRDGVMRHFVVNKTTLCNERGEATGFITTHVDVTDLKSAENRAEEQLRLTGVILETSPAPMMVKDKDRRITYINTAYENLFGVRRSDLLYRTMRADHSSENLSRIGRMEQELLASGGTRTLELRLPAVNGREVFCIVTKATYLDAGGATGGLVTTYSDITALKEAEQVAAERLRLTNALLDATPIPMVVKNRDLHVILVNTAYERMFEITRDAVMNSSIVRLRPEVARDVEAAERQLIEQPGLQQAERVLTMSSGRKAHCIITKSTYSNQAGEVAGIITVFTEITELKRTEENLIAARHAAEAAMRARSQFLANMSHEIRTPMNGVLGMTSLLAATGLDGEQRQFLDALRVSGEAMLKILNDILDFSKIEAGKVGIERTAFDVRSRIAAVMHLFTAPARERNLDFTSDIAAGVPAAVVGDPVRIGQVLSNLVANAIKFTLEGSVRVVVDVASREAGRLALRFTVSDTGVGIAPEAIERIFTPFMQEDGSTTRRFGGTGLGLTISRELVELMGGALHAESTPGKGSRFTFTVMVNEAAAPRETSLPAAGGDARARPAAMEDDVLAVLLAEDNVVNQLVATRMLEKLGCKVTVASDGTQAIDLASRGRFDLIFMDCHMPGMDGFAATAAIRAMEKHGARRHIIIAQTANAMEGDRETCLAASMDDYLTKPLSLDALSHVIRRWVPRTAEKS